MKDKHELPGHMKDKHELQVMKHTPYELPGHMKDNHMNYQVI